MADEPPRKQLHFLSKIPQRRCPKTGYDYSRTCNNTGFLAKTSKKCKISVLRRLTFYSKNSINNATTKNKISDFFHPGSKILPLKSCDDACCPPFIIDFDTVFLHFILSDLFEISFPALICALFLLYLYKPWRYAPVHGMRVA